MDRYVDPLVTHLKAMLNYRKFRQGAKAEVDELLRNEKNDTPLRIVYSFGISHEHPGTFILTYIRSSNPHHEYIGLYPKGFKFRKRMFDNIDRLVAYFQRHINDPIHESPSIRSVAAMVPMRSPATGGSSGGGGWSGSGGNDGGWRGSSDRDHSTSRGGKFWTMINSILCPCYLLYLGKGWQRLSCICSSSALASSSYKLCCLLNSLDPNITIITI